jgi:hypothetical protein
MTRIRIITIAMIRRTWISPLIVRLRRYDHGGGGYYHHHDWHRKNGLAETSLGLNRRIGLNSVSDRFDP